MSALRLIRRATAAAFLIPLFFVWRFFAGERFYPHTPIHPSLGELPPWVDAAALAAIVVLLLALSVFKNVRPLLGVFLVLTLGFSLWDQSRWMPYFYQFWFMFLLLYSSPREDGLPKESEERVLNGLRCVILGIWFWSGLHKISAAYVAIGYPWMISPLLRFVPAEYHQLVLSSSFMSPIVETGSALLLLFPRTRIVGILALTSMHLLILVIFGPFGLNWNPSVWSWNVAMILYLWVCFFRCDATAKQILLGTGRDLRERLIHWTVAILFIVMPLANFWGYWDDFLSHCLYSWTTKEAEIVVPPESESLLPEEMRRNIKRDHAEPLISVLDWSFDIFNSPPYHSYRVFFSVFGKVCEHTKGDQGLTFRIFEKPDIATAHSERISYKCFPEAGPKAIRQVERRP